MPDVTSAESIDPTGPRIPFTYEQEWYRADTRGSRGTHKNVRLSYEILGALDPDALTEALRAFVVRHDALRMDPLPADPQHPTGAQRIRGLDPHETLVHGQSVTAVSAEQFSRYASAVLSRDFTRPWAEGQERPLCLRLLRYGPDHHALLATFQNLVFDGRAHHVFAREIWRDYEALRAGAPIPLTAPSFAEAAVEQRTAHGPRHLARARASWRERVEFAARHSWVRPRGATATAGGSVRGHLGAAATLRLRRACASYRCTVLQKVVASFVQALARTADVPRVALWTTMDSRRSRHQDLVGMLAGVCPLTVRDPAAAPQAVTEEVRDGMLDALRHQQLTADELMALGREFSPEGDAPLSRDVLVSLRRFEDDYRPVRHGGGDLRITADAYPLRRTALIDSSALHLRCDEYRDRILVDLRHDGDRVGQPLAQTVLDRLLGDLSTTPTPRQGAARSTP